MQPALTDPFRIGDVEIANRVLLAPLAGIGNWFVRLQARRHGAGLAVSEMVSSFGLHHGNERTLRELLRLHPDEHPVSVQLFGQDPEVMRSAAESVAGAGADLIDINMGCPVKKVVKTGAGASLLRDKGRIAEILRAVRKSCPLPLTVKIRAGWSPMDPVACEVAHIAEDCGADAITVHPRFATQSFSTPADWSWIRKVKATVKIPVIGNGDVGDATAALRMKAETGCDGVMIGRGAVRNPWIFRQTLNQQKGLPVTEPGLEDRKSFIMDH